MRGPHEGGFAKKCRKVDSMTCEDTNDVNRRHAMSPLVRARLAVDDIAVMARMVIVPREVVPSVY
jgi:hypothetical protein